MNVPSYHDDIRTVLGNSNLLDAEIDCARVLLGMMNGHVRLTACPENNYSALQWHLESFRADTKQVKTVEGGFIEICAWQDLLNYLLGNR